MYSSSLFAGYLLADKSLCYESIFLSSEMKMLPILHNRFYLLVICYCVVKTIELDNKMILGVFLILDLLMC